MPGQTYRFDQSDSSNSGHPIKFSTTQYAWAYTTNVTAVGTPGQSEGTYHFSYSKRYRYYCANHSNMGGAITGTHLMFPLHLEVEIMILLELALQ